MPFLKEKDRTTIKEYFQKNLKNPVELILFTQGQSELDIPIEHKCSLCQETEDLLTELVDLHEKINLTIFDFIKEEKLAQEYGIERLPAIIVKGQPERHVRFFGIPSGYEFSSLTKDIVLVSQNSTELTDETKEKLKSIQEEVHIQVFVTPTCPYCPRAVIMAHQFAMENPNIIADMIEASEFVDLSTKYGVMGVPKIIINDRHYFEGALPENLYLAAVLKSLRQSVPEEQLAQLDQYLKDLKI